MPLPHILLINDDGPPSNKSSPYIHSFATELERAGCLVSVCLPHVQRSWAGKAHLVSEVVTPTYFTPGTLHVDDGVTQNFPSPGNKDWVLCNATPAGCAQLGLYHFFKDRPQIDLVVSGPNYGRNSTSVFALSSGTIGGAMEGAVCGFKAISLSYAFLSRDHSPPIVKEASELSVKLVLHLYNNWDKGVDLYSINVPLEAGISKNKILYTNILKNVWDDGSSFAEMDPEEDELNETADEREVAIRRRESDIDSKSKVEFLKSLEKVDQPESANGKYVRRKFHWAPKFGVVYRSVDASEPGNDGITIRDKMVSVTPLVANFAHVSGLSGEIKLPSQLPKIGPPLFITLSHPSPYLQPLLASALSRLVRNPVFSPPPPSSASQHLLIADYEALPHDSISDAPNTLINAYTYRKALIRKHYLARTVELFCAKHKATAEGKALRAGVPEGCEIEVDWVEFLDEALEEAYEVKESWRRMEDSPEAPKEWWILKPGMGDRGQGIRLFSTEEELTAIFEEWEAAVDSEEEEEEEDAASDSDAPSAHQPGDKQTDINPSHLRHFLLQRYIDPPLLLPASPPSPLASRKFHLRVYVLALGALRIYTHPSSILALFAPSPYSPPTSTSTSSLSPHLTNTCLGSGPVSLFSSLPLAPGTKAGIVEQVNNLTALLFRAAATTSAIHFQPHPNAFEIFGLDFMVDAEGRVYVLEVNAFPDFGQTGEGPQEKGGVEMFAEDVVREIVGWKWSREYLNDTAGNARLECVLDLKMGIGRW